MSHIYEELKRRGFIKQETAPIQIFEPTTHELVETISLQSILDKGHVTFYVGFDPTADSMHIGHLLPIMVMAHLQKSSHMPICIIGGGTTMIGDPSGKTKMRQMLSKEEIASNGEILLKQLMRYLSFGEGVGLFLNNADWLLPLNYIEFLRDYGKYFKVNEMLRAEAYKARMEREEGLSFIEFNYQLLQAYDFIHLYEQHGCTVQMGGDDQWSNILAGIDLIRKVKQGNAHGLTFPLLTTARGQKMGKTESGAVWLDSTKTSPFEYYQYWVNVDDKDVEKFLKLFTFLSMEEIAQLCSKVGQHLRVAKEVLAYEATKITHGEPEAEKARTVSKALFSGTSVNASNVPSTTITRSEANEMRIVEILVRVGFCKSKTEAVKLISGGGVSLNGAKVTNGNFPLSQFLGDSSRALFRKGKKTYHRVVVE